MFLKPPFGFYLIFCQTIMLPQLQDHRLWLEIVTYNWIESAPFFQWYAGRSLGRFLNEILVTQSWRLQQWYFHENCISFINYWVIQTNILTTPIYCYLLTSLGSVDLVIPLYQVHTYLPWPIFLLTPVCTHDRHFFRKCFKISL